MKTINPFMGLALCGIAAQAQEKPNFLIIQCDHLTQRVVGAYGHTQGCTLPIDERALQLQRTDQYTYTGKRSDIRKPFFGKRLRSCTLRKNARYGFIKRIQT